MYAVGETFYHEIFEEEYELHVIGDLIENGKEYIIAEDFDGEKYAFVYDENEEELSHIEDEDDAIEVMDFWETEYSGAASANIGDWEGDEYYDREDSKTDENYAEVDGLDELEEDVDSFISGLLGGQQPQDS